MQDFIFHNPTKIYFGRNHMPQLPRELAAFGTRVLLAYGGGSIKNNGIYQQITALLDKGGFTVWELPGIEANPRHTSVNKGVALCRQHAIDVLLAVGGGSVIDCCKGIAATVFADTDDVWDIVERRVGYEKALPLVCVLTMAATGSEMNRGAVISNEPRNLKRSLGSDLTRPRVSFLNPEFTYSVPAFQTACGAVDIMSHIFDVTYITGQDQLDMARGMQEELLRTVISWAPVALREPDNYRARANLMWAATWALNGFLANGVDQNTVCHKMEHELSAHYNITHGLGLAILIPRWLSYILGGKTAPVIARFGRACLGVEDVGAAPDPADGSACSAQDMQAARQTITRLEDFYYGTLGLECRLSALGIDSSRFETMAQSAVALGTHKSIVPLDKDDIIAIYQACL